MSKKLRVLIVEDSEDDAELVLRELRSGGYELISERVDTHKAMADALKNKTWDVVISDYSMPHFNGFQALELLRSTTALDIPCIIVSGKIGEATAVDLMKAGANDYMMKGNLQRLASSIERELSNAVTRRERKLAEEQIVRLNTVLRALRNINQLITKESDPGKLLKGACDNMIKSRGYSSAWIALFDDAGKSLFTTESGLGKAFLPMFKRLQRGELTECGRHVLKQPGLFIKDPSSDCADCPLATTRVEKAAIAARLEYDTKTYGMLAVSLTSDLTPDMEEQSLFQELADDIAFGLYKIEMEEQRKQAEHQVRERVKELQAFYHLSKLTESEDMILGEFYQEFANILQESWQYPEITCVRIVMGDSEFRTKNFMESDWKKSAPVKVSGAEVGRIDVGYLEERPKKYEGPFLKEEILLIDAIAKQLGYITGRMQAREALRTKDNIVTSSINAIALADLKGDLTYVNPAFLEMWGYSRSEEVLGKPSVSFWQMQDKAEQIVEALQSKGSWQGELIAQKKDGSFFDVQLSGNMVIDEKGNPLYMSGAFIDITERKQAEQALRASETSYRELADSITDVFFAFDNDLIYTYWNKASEQLTGVKAEDTIGKHIYDIFPDTEETREAEKQYLQAIKTKQAQTFTTEYSLNDKRYCFEISVYPTINGISVFTRDITERKQAEEERKQSYQKLQETIQNAIQAIASIAETRDPYTAGHQQRVTKLACAIGEEIGLSKDKIEEIHIAGILHDVGKMNVPAEILSKPGKLSEIEMSLIKTHPQVGRDILTKLELPWAICPTVLQHHERMDGSGYPSGLSGEDIALEARVLAVADVVEAMASHRPYRPALGIDKALEEIAKSKGKLYDPDVVDACLKLFKEKGFKFELPAKECST